jgi:hypothetical protein
LNDNLKADRTLKYNMPEIKLIDVPNFEGRYFIDLEGNMYSQYTSKYASKITNKITNITKDYLGNRFVYLKRKASDLATRFEIDAFLDEYNKRNIKT